MDQTDVAAVLLTSRLVKPIGPQCIAQVAGMARRTLSLFTARSVRRRPGPARRSVVKGGDRHQQVAALGFEHADRVVASFVDEVAAPIQHA